MWFLSLNSVYFSLRESFKSVPVSAKGSTWSAWLPSMHGGYSTCLQIARRTALSRTAYGTLQSQSEQTKIRENPNSNSIWFVYPGASSFGGLLLLGSHRLVGQHGDSAMSCDGVTVTAMDLKGQGWGHTALPCVPPAQDFNTCQPKGVILHAALKPLWSLCQWRLVPLLQALDPVTST